MSGIATALTIAILSWIFAGYRALHAKRIAELKAMYNVEELFHKYDQTRKTATLLFLFIGIPGAIAGGVFLGKFAYQLAEQHYWRTSETKFLMTPTWLIIYFVLGFLTFFLIGLIMAAVLRITLGKAGYREYEVYDSIQSGFDSRRILGALLIAIITPLVILLVMSVDNFIRVEDDALVVNPFWTLGGQRYTMQDVTKLEVSYEERVLNDQARSIPYHRLVLADGRSWQTQGPLAVEVNPERLAANEKLFEFLSQQSGKWLEKVPR